MSERMTDERLAELRRVFEPYAAHHGRMQRPAHSDIGIELADALTTERAALQASAGRVREWAAMFPPREAAPSGMDYWRCQTCKMESRVGRGPESIPHDDDCLWHAAALAEKETT